MCTVVNSGISQGCTLRSLLFIVAMSVLLHDAVGLLGPSAAQLYSTGDLADLVYADDTLIIGVDRLHIEEYLQAVYVAGQRYGMELHFGKLQLISSLNVPHPVTTPLGTTIEPKLAMDYLGSSIHGDGCADHEISRRIATARGDFDALAKTWTHSSLTWKEKLHILASLVESRLLYSLASLVFTAAQKRKIDGFQNRCLRRIIGVPPACISRVSNAAVLAKASYRRATDLLLKKRLQLFGKILRSPEGHLLRTAAFIPGTTTPATERFVSRVGRPAKEWIREAVQETVALFASLHAALPQAMEKEKWNIALFDKLDF